MNISIPIIIAISVILLLCLAVFVYLKIYKKNINKALSEDGSKPKQMMSPHKLVFVLIVFLVSFSITVTSVAGLLYSKEYFSYEKAIAEDIASRTIFVDCNFENTSIRKMNHSDVDRIRNMISAKYPGRNINTIPVYDFNSGIYLDGSLVNLFAIDEKNCSFLGLNEMQDNTAYFLDKKMNKAEFDICVTKIVDGGFVSDKLEHLTLDAKGGVSEESLVSVIKKENMMPSEFEDPVCFVNMNTFYKMASIMLDADISGVSDLGDYSELAELEGVYICVDSLSCLSSVLSVLVEQKYNAHAPIDAFGDYEKTISTTFTIFILSSVGLVCLSAVNIYLVLRTSNQLKKKR